MANINEKVVTRFLRKVGGEEPVEAIAVNRMLDLANMVVAFNAHTVWTLSKGGKPTPVGVKGAAVLRRFLADLQAAVEQHVAPIIDDPAAASLHTVFNVALRSGTPEQKAQNLAALFTRLMPWARSRPHIFNSIFSGSRVSRAARELAAVCEEESPEAILNKCATIAPISGLMITRKWMETAAAEAGVPITVAESAVAEASAGQNLGEDLNEVQAKLDSAAPNTPAAASLQESKSAILRQINEAAAQSSAPAAVMAAAATAAVNPSKTSVARRFRLTDEQESVMLANGKLCIGAGAGSGKSTTLIAGLVHMTESRGIQAGRILACSFTRAASASLELKAEKAGVNGAFIGTTHKVAREIISRNRPQLANAMRATKAADKAFKIAIKQVEMDVAGFAAQVDQNRVTIQRIEAISGWRGLEILKSFHDQLSRGRPLSEKQLAILPKFERGGGKRWAAGEDIESVWSLTLGKEAADEIEAHWAKLAADFGDGKETPAPKGMSKFWSVPAGQWFNVSQKILNADGKPMGPKQILLQVDNFKNSGISVDQARADLGDTPIVAVYGAYEWLKKNDPILSPCMDYTDQILVAQEILETDPRALANEQARWDAVLVDEAQDLNEIQFRMFKLLGGKAKVLSFIGDDKQSIYAFRGAKPANYVNLSKDPEFQTLLMTTNFRSGSAIVEAANKLISHNGDRQIPMVCKSHEPRGVGQIRALGSEDHESAAKEVSQEIKSAVDSGESLAQSDGTPTFGILVRNNAEADAYTLSLIARSIPYRMLKKSEGGYFGKPLVKALSAWIRLIIGGADQDMNDAFTEAHRTPGFGMDEAFAANLGRNARGNYYDYCAAGGQVYTGPAAWMNKKVAEYVNAVQTLRATARGDSATLVRTILDMKGPKGSFKDALVRLVDEDEIIEDEGGEGGEEALMNAAMAPVRPLMMMAESMPDPTRLLAMIAKMKGANEKVQKKNPSEPEDWKEPAVLVGTVHGWKGLEAKHVYVCMAGGVFPHFKSALSDDPTALDEERRLAYVAITRGQETTTVVSPGMSYLGKPSAPSRFIGEACIRIEGDNIAGSEVNEELDRAIAEAEAESNGKTARVAAMDAADWMFASDEDESILEGLE